MEIRSLGNTDFDELFGAFEQAFADYEVQIDKAEHRAMLKRRGFDPNLSFAAFDKGKIVSFTCNGTGDFYGTPTAYDTGTGTLKDYRGQGLATRVFEYSIPLLKEAGIGEYLLEVLQHNTGAVSVYRNIGFEVTREFYYFRAEAERIKNVLKPIVFPYTLQRIDIGGPGSLSSPLSEVSSFWDFRPSWQNSMESVERSPECFACFGVFTEGKLIGYAIFEPASGDVTQIAVNRDYRCRGVGSLLLNEMLKINKCGAIKVINTDIGCDSITSFLRSKDIEPSGKQFEMTIKL